MREIWHHPLSREILLILIVKISLVFAIWWVFFRAPETAPLSPEQVSQAMLQPRPAVDQHKE